MIQNTQDRNKITSETSNYPIQIVRDSELNSAVKSEWIALLCVEVKQAVKRVSEYNVEPPHKCQGLN